MIGGDAAVDDCGRAAGAGGPEAAPVALRAPPRASATIGGVPFAVDRLTLSGFEIGPGSLDERTTRSIFRVRLEIRGDGETALVETDAAPVGDVDRPIRAFRFISLTPDQSRTLQRWAGMPVFFPSPPHAGPSSATGAPPRPAPHSASYSTSYRAIHQFNPILTAISIAIALGFGALYFGVPALQAALSVPSVSAMVVPSSYRLSLASAVPPPRPVRVGQTETRGELIGYLPRGGGKDGADNRIPIYSPCVCSVAGIERADPGQDGGDLVVNLVESGGLGLRLAAHVIEDDWKMLEADQPVEVSFNGVPYPVLGRVSSLSGTMPPDHAGRSLAPSGDAHALRAVTVTIDRWPGVGVFPPPGEKAVLRFPVRASRMLAHYTGFNLPFLDDWLRPDLRGLDGGSAASSSSTSPSAPPALADRA